MVSIGARRVASWAVKYCHFDRKSVSQLSIAETILYVHVLRPSPAPDVLSPETLIASTNPESRGEKFLSLSKEIHAAFNSLYLDQNGPTLARSLLDVLWGL